MLHDCWSQQISSLHLSYPQFTCSILGNFFVGKYALLNFICGIGLNGKKIKRCELDLKHVSATLEADVAVVALLKCVIFVKFSYSLLPR